ncbi:hypothetical protein SAMN04489844_2727 [Nocardioides exalbidus]|uniref:Uncharacterized protein n=1 Tax=Nocardioides exalbidus TaxID=402596 RepID=A0A1H4UBN6_9ACTN|nr:hypothetical protein SAMN04489844_2727 [Nocardioides exalbidus]
MSGDGARVRRAWTGLVLVAALGTGCASGPVEPVTADPWVEGGLPAYCDGRGGELTDFWEVVHQTCAIAQDGDELQGAVLEDVLAQLPATTSRSSTGPSTGSTGSSGRSVRSPTTSASRAWAWARTSAPTTAAG